MTNNNASNESVLIIDDDKMILKLLTIVFEGLGFSEINCFQNSVVALEKLTLNSNNYNLIVLDLMMPEMDGIQFLRKLVDIKYAGYVLLMSGTDRKILSSLEKLSGKQLKILGAIEKPVTPAKLKPLLSKMNSGIKVVIKKQENEIHEEDIEQALQNSEFIPYFQPKIELSTNKILGFESLARWKTKEGEIISPIRFIPLAEATGQIFSIDTMILEKTSQMMMAWQMKGLDLIGSVNFSATSLGQKDSSESILQITQSYGLHLAQLVFELTESILIKEDDPAMENILRLHLYGAHLSMDDFGTGYSGMQYLQQIPFAELKIDQCFVHGALLDQSKSAIIESSVDLAAKLGLKTVCEGVESYEDLAVIKAVGANMGQGYYFSKPLPAVEFQQWVESYADSQSQRNG